MRARITIFFLALWVFPTLAQTPLLTAQWNQTNTAVLVTRGVAGCLWLTGGNKEPKWLDVGCGADPVLLRAGGVDHLEAPQGRVIQLRGPNGEVFASLAVPERRWRQTLVLVVK